MSVTLLMPLHELNYTWTNRSHLSFENIRLFTTPLYILVEELVVIINNTLPAFLFFIKLSFGHHLFALQIGDTLQLTDRRVDSQQDTCCHD